MLPSLGVALTETGRPEETDALLSDAVKHSRAAGSERDALRATIQLLSNRVYRSPTDTEIEAAIIEAEQALETFDALADDVGQAETTIALEYLEFTLGQMVRSHEWAHRALRHGLAASSFRESAQAAADIVGTAALGPVPFGQLAAMAKERLFALDEPISASAGHALAVVSGVAAGDEAARLDHEQRWHEVVDRHGLSWLGAAQALIIAGVETSAGNPRRPSGDCMTRGTHCRPWATSGGSRPWTASCARPLPHRTNRSGSSAWLTYSTPPRRCSIARS